MDFQVQSVLYNYATQRYAHYFIPLINFNFNPQLYDCQSSSCLSYWNCFLILKSNSYQFKPIILRGIPNKKSIVLDPWFGMKFYHRMNYSRKTVHCRKINFSFLISKLLLIFLRFYLKCHLLFFYFFVNFCGEFIFYSFD